MRCGWIFCLSSSAGLTESDSEAKLVQSCQSAPTTLMSGTTERCSTRDVGLQTCEMDMLPCATVTETVWTLVEPDTATATVAGNQSAPVTEDKDASGTDKIPHPSEPANPASSIKTAPVIQCRSIENYSAVVPLVGVRIQLAKIHPRAHVDSQHSKVIKPEDKAATTSATEEDTQQVPTQGSTKDNDRALNLSNIKVLCPSEPPVTKMVQSSYILAADCADTDADEQFSEITTTKYEENKSAAASATDKDIQHLPTPTPAITEKQKASSAGDAYKLHPSEPMTCASVIVAVESLYTLAAACPNTDADDQCSDVTTVRKQENSTATMPAMEENIQHLPTPANTREKGAACVSATDKLQHPSRPMTSASAVKTAPVVECHLIKDNLTAVQLVAVRVQLSVGTDDQCSKVTITKHVEKKAATPSVTKYTQRAATENENRSYVSDSDKLPYQSEQMTAVSETEMVHSSYTLAADCRDTDDHPLTRGQHRLYCSKVTTIKHEDSTAAVSVTDEDTQHPPTPAHTEDEDAEAVTDTDKLPYHSESEASGLATEIIQSSYTLAAVCSDTDGDSQCSEVTTIKHEEDSTAAVSVMDEDTQHPPTPANTEDEDAEAVTDTDKLLYHSESLASVSATEVVQSSYALAAVCSETDGESQCSEVTTMKHEESKTTTTTASVTDKDTQHPPTVANTGDKDAESASDTDKLQHPSEPMTSASATRDKDAESASDTENEDADAVTDTDKLLYHSESVASVSATEVVQSSYMFAAVCSDTDGHSQCSEATTMKHDDTKTATIASATDKDTQHPPSTANTGDKDAESASDTENEDAEAVTDTDKLVYHSDSVASGSATEVVQSSYTLAAVCSETDGDSQCSEVTTMKHEDSKTTTTTALVTDEDTHHPPTTANTGDEDVESASDTDNLQHPSKPTTSASATKTVQSSYPLAAACYTNVNNQCSIVTTTNHREKSAATASEREVDSRPWPKPANNENEDVVVGSITGKLRYPSELVTRALAVKIAPAVKSHSVKDFLPPVQLVAVNIQYLVVDNTDVGDHLSKVTITKHVEDKAASVSVTEDTQQAATDDECAAYVSNRLLFPCEPVTSVSATEMVQSLYTLAAACSNTDTDSQCSKVTTTNHQEDSAATASAAELDTQHLPTPLSTKKEDAASVRDTDKLRHPSEPMTSATAVKTASVVESLKDFSIVVKLVEVNIQFPADCPDKNSRDQCSVVTIKHKDKAEAATALATEDSQRASTEDENMASVSKTNKLLYAFGPMTSTSASQMVQSSYTLEVACPDTDSDSEVTTIKHEDSTAAVSAVELETHHPPTPENTDEEDAASVPVTSLSAVKTASVVESHSVEDFPTVVQLIAVDVQLPVDCHDADAHNQCSGDTITKHKSKAATASASVTEGTQWASTNNEHEVPTSCDYKLFRPSEATTYESSAAEMVQSSYTSAAPCTESHTDDQFREVTTTKHDENSTATGSVVENTQQLSTLANNEGENAATVDDTDKLRHPSQPATSASATKTASVVESRSVDDLSTAVQLVAVNVQFLVACPETDAHGPCRGVTITIHGDCKASESATEHTKRASTNDKHGPSAVGTNKLLYPSEPASSASATEVVQSSYTVAAASADTDADNKWSEVNTTEHEEDGTATASAMADDARHQPTPANADDEDAASVGHADGLLRPSEPATSASTVKTATVVESRSVEDFSTAVQPAAVNVRSIAIYPGTAADDGQRNDVTITIYEDKAAAASATEEDAQHLPTPASAEHQRLASDAGDTDKVLHPSETGTSASATDTSSSVAESRSLDDVANGDDGADDQHSKVIATRYLDDSDETLLATLNRNITTDKLRDDTGKSSPADTASEVCTQLLRYDTTRHIRPIVHSRAVSLITEIKDTFEPPIHIYKPVFIIGFHITLNSHQSTNKSVTWSN